MSYRRRHMHGEKRLRDCAKIEESDVPAHSNLPASRETPKVIGVGTVDIPSVANNSIKFAVTRDVQYAREVVGKTKEGN